MKLVPSNAVADLFRLLREPRLPRYFFHAHDDEDFIDKEGVELGGLEEAKTQAIIAATEMLREKSSLFWSGSVWTMDIVDDTGVRVAGLSFRADKN